MQKPTRLRSKLPRWPWWVGGAAVAVIAGVVVCEAIGWPFLAAPMQRWLTKALDRPVSFAADSEVNTVRVRLFGSIRVTAGRLTIGAPSWSQQPYMLEAQDARVALAYRDLWRAYQGGALHIRRLEARTLDMRLERLADGRSSWQFGKAAPDASEQPMEMPTFGVLQVEDGRMKYADAVIATDIDGRFSLVERAGRAASTAADGASVAVGTAPSRGPSAGASAPPGLQASATGTYKKFPVRIEAHTSGVLPLLADEQTLALPVTIDARVGRTGLRFDGSATDALHLGGLRGRFDVYGPSLAAVGDPLGVTLPTTAPFRTTGRLAKDGNVWKAVFEQATVGDSKLSGAFTYDAGRARPLLAGRLQGTRLLLADLGPTVGAPVMTGQGVAPAAPAESQASTSKPGRVLPDRPFDLPSLRAMDANVLIDIADLDLGSNILQPLRPLRTVLILDHGVLTLNDIDARTADGRLGGKLTLDGRGEAALWDARLNWSNVRLERWIKQSRKDGAPPYVAGRLNGDAALAGEGRSTAAILGSLKGSVRMYLLDGQISHLAIEAAGLDIAQGLGVMLKGDDALPVNCGVADLTADRGALKPRALVLDTRDSTLWIDGSLSLATEALDLRAIVEPKDFSPLALRTPIRVRGTFADPSVSLEKGPLGARVGAAALLAFINPLAAIVPLMDIGSGDEAKAGAEKCRALAARKIGGKPAPPQAARPSERGAQRPL